MSTAQIASGNAGQNPEAPVPVSLLTKMRRLDGWSMRVAIFLFLGVIALAQAAFAASPVSFVQDIPIPLEAVIGLVSFPSGSAGGVPYPAQSFLVFDKSLCLVTLGSSPQISPLASFFFRRHRQTWLCRS